MAHSLLFLPATDTAHPWCPSCHWQLLRRWATDNHSCNSTTCFTQLRPDLTEPFTSDHCSVPLLPASRLAAEGYDVRKTLLHLMAMGVRREQQTAPMIADLPLCGSASDNTRNTTLSVPRFEHWRRADGARPAVPYADRDTLIAVWQFVPMPYRGV